MTVDLRRLDALALPVEDVVDEVRDALAAPGAAVLVAEPGAGKTTGIPLRLLDEAWLGDRRLVVLEPRRVAVRAAARRMAALLGEDVGATVGYRTRDDAEVGSGTRIEVVTDGILLRRLQDDPSLPGVAGVMVDEFHERSLVADLALAFAIETRAALRPDLRLLVASATLDGDRVARLVGGDDPVPVVASAGRLHPVRIEWRATPPGDVEAALAAEVGRSVRAGALGVLAFLPGAAAIERARRSLSDVDARVLGLYGALPREEQDQALRPGPPGQVKVVLSTDLAETSVTVEGIDVVVDSGLARRPRFDPRSGMTRLATTAVSRASAEQRAGRAGRTGPGRVVRLWSQGDHATRPAYTAAEMENVDLAGLVLECALWGTADPSSLSLLDPPPAAAWAEGRNLLGVLGALDGGGLTSAGRAMAGLPLHPRLARMVLGGAEQAMGWTACVLAALLEERDVLSGRPGRVPVDLVLRAEVIDGQDHPDAAGRRVAQARRRARELARRVEAPVERVRAPDVGRCLLWAYPDRVGRARPGRRGHFLLRSGTGVRVPETDVLAGEPFLVVADVDARRRPAEVRQAAGVDEETVLDAMAGQIDMERRVLWDSARNDVVVREETTLGAIVLASSDRRPSPGPDVIELLIARVADRGLGALRWSDATRSLRARSTYLRSELGGDWPDLGDDALLAGLDEWLAPLLVAATGRRDLDTVDTAAAIALLLGRERVNELERLAPDRLDLASGRSAPIDYRDGPRVTARVQEIYGTTRTPAILGGRVPISFDLRSPADRSVQITADLAGFWAGSWREVRRDMVGRYPKHDWPDDPTTAAPGHPGGGARRRRR